MSDFNLEFDAPMFVDFTNLDRQEEADPEAYFEVNHEDIPVDDNGEEAGENAANEAVEEAGAGATTSGAADEGANKSCKNVVKSWKEVMGGAPDTPTRRAQRAVVSQTVGDITNSPKVKIPESRRSKVNLPSNSSSQNLPVKKTVAPAQPPPLVKAVAKASPAKAAPVKTSSGVSTPGRWRKIVKQLTPEIMRQARKRRQQKESEAGGNGAAPQPSSSSNNEAMQALKASLARNRARNQIAATKKFLGATSAPSVSRAASAAPFVPSVAHSTSKEPVKGTEEPGFSKMLRSYQQHPTNSGMPVCTQVKPFSFSTDQRSRSRHRSVDTSTHSTASSSEGGSSIGKLSRPADLATRRRSRSASPAWAKLTKPQTPNLATRGRARVVVPPPVETKQPGPSKASGPMRAFHFSTEARARSRNRSVESQRGSSSAQHLAQPQQQTNRRRSRSTSPWKELTKPQTPNLATRGRARPGIHVQSHQEREDQEMQSMPTFKANFPIRVPGKQQGVPALAHHEPIVPASPAFALKNRMEERSKRKLPDPVEPEPKRIPYAKPVPSQQGVPVILPSFSKKATTVKPFSFDARDSATQVRKEQKIQAVFDEEKKMREFKAKPVPEKVIHPAPVQVPVIEATKPEPFALEIDKRVDERHLKWEQSVKEALRQQREAANFKATGADILKKDPFRPKPSEKAPSSMDDFQLHSDRRAMERQAFDVRVKQKEAEQEAMKKHKEVMIEREKQEEIRKLREQAVHKAQPIHKYKPIEIQHNVKFTDAKSPDLSYKRSKK